MMRSFRLRRDERGATLMEFGLIAPFLMSLIISSAQVGILFFANTGLQHAVGEGARLAMVWPRPSTEDIQESVRDSKYGLDDRYLVGDPIVTYGTDASGSDFADISWSYRAPLDFIFFETPPVTLQHSRRAYLQAAAGAGGGGAGGGGGTSTSTSTGGVASSTGGDASSSTGSTSSTGGDASTSTGGETSSGSTTSTGSSTTSSTSTSTTSSTSSTSSGNNASSGNGNGSSGGSTTSTSTSTTSSTSTGGSSGSSSSGNGNGKGSQQAKGNGKK